MWLFQYQVNCDMFRFSVGTAYGFVVFDYAQRKAVLSHCTVISAGLLILCLLLCYLLGLLLTACLVSLLFAWRRSKKSDHASSGDRSEPGLFILAAPQFHQSCQSVTSL